MGPAFHKEKSPNWNHISFPKWKTSRGLKVDLGECTKNASGCRNIPDTLFLILKYLRFSEWKFRLVQTRE